MQSLQQNKMWSFAHSSFNFEPPYANFDVDGYKYTWRDGIFSIVLANRNGDGYRTAYYHPMARYIFNNFIVFLKLFSCFHSRSQPFRVHSEHKSPSKRGGFEEIR